MTKNFKKYIHVAHKPKLFNFTFNNQYFLSNYLVPSKSTVKWAEIGHQYKIRQIVFQAKFTLENFYFVVCVK